MQIDTVTTHRKLSAIVSADVASYSRLMADNEEETLRALNESRALFRNSIEAHGGRLIDTAGDSVLAEFVSPVEAVNASLEIQRALADRNAQLPEHRRMQFRIGINLGDVIEQEDGTIYGDGVNVAARLQQLAEPGGICISGTAFDQVEGKLPVQFKFIGKQQVKNIAKPVRAYQGQTEARAATGRGGVWRRITSAVRLPVIGAAVLILLIAAGTLTWQGTRSRALGEDPVLAMPKGPSIAVLPFANFSGDPAQEYFSDGLTEDLITGLSRFRELLVIGRNTTFRFKGQAVDIRKVGRELGARYVVEGSVRRGGKTVRVNVQLLDANNGTHLWADSFDRELSVAELFALQDEITARVIGAIAGSYGAISRTHRDTVRTAGTDNLEAYDCVLQAYAYEQLLTPEAHAITRDCLERAVKLDPKYADAWSKLAFVYADEYAFGYNPRSDPLDRALEAAQRAVEIDPSSGTTHWHLARTHFWRNEVQEGVTEAERALALNPNNAFVLAAAGAYMAPTGGNNLKRAVQLTSKALRIDPNPPGWYYVPQILFHYDRREYEAALAASLKMNMPKFFHTYVWRTAIYGELGRSADASASRANLLQLYPTYAKNARHELEKFNVNPALADHVIEGLRKAGLEIPDEKT